MATKKYYGSAQFSPIAQQRTHDDRFIKEILMTGSTLDIDLSDFMREDIMVGNTATLRKFNKTDKTPEFTVSVIDGTSDTKIPFIKAINQDFYPIIPIKDDESGPGGYVSLPDDNERKRSVEKSLGYLDLDLDELSEALLTPSEIPDVGTTEWDKDYGKQWKDSPSLQEEYGTEQAWHDSLVEARAEQLKHIDDITDIHVGLYATAGTLDESNIIAVYHEFAKLLPQLSFRGYEKSEVEDFPPQTYIFQVNSGHWLTVNGMRGWTHIIRNGVVENKFDTDGSVDMYNKKSNVNFYYEDDYAKKDTDGDPIHKIIRSDPAWQTIMGTEDESVFKSTGIIGDSKACMELQVQLTRGDNPTYGEIRVWNYETTHIVTNDSDDKVTLIRGDLGGKIDGLSEGPSIGEEYQEPTINNGETYVGTYGTGDIDVAWSVAEMYAGPMFTIGAMSGELNFKIAPAAGVYYVKIVAVGNGPEDTGAQSSIYLTVTVLNTDGSEPTAGTPPWTEEGEGANKPGDDYYDDLCYFPIGRESTKEVPFFKRERLIRETVQVGIYSVKIVKLKWYQERWFSVVMFVVAILLSWITSGQSLVVFFQTMLVSTAIGLAIGIVIKVLSRFISNPFIIAIAVVVVGVMTGYFDTSNFMQLANIAMDVTNTAIKEVMANKMKELQEQVREFNREVQNLQEEMDRMMEEVGLMRVDAWEYLKQMLVIPEAEMPATLIARTLDVNSSLKTSVVSMTDVENIWESMITQQ